MRITSISELTSFAFFRMSTPLKSPNRMSVTTTSHGSISSFRTASSPEEASWTANPASSSDSRTPTRNASLSSTIRILSATAVPHRDLDDEFGTLSDFAVHVQNAAMGVHDLLGERQPDPGPGFFRGEEGDEDPILYLRRDPGSVVANVDPDELLLLPQLTGKEQFDLPVEPHRLGEVTGCPHKYVDDPFPMAGIHRVRQDVRQRLLEERGIRIHLQIAVRRFLYRKLHPGVEGDHSRDDPVQKRIHRNLLDPQFRWTHEIQAFPDDIFHLLHFPGHHADRGKEFLVSGQIGSKKAGVNADAGDRIPDLVRQPRRPLPEHQQSLFQVRAFLGHLHVGQVLEEGADPAPVVPLLQFREREPEALPLPVPSRQLRLHAGG